MYLMESKTWIALFENWQKNPSDLSRQFSQLLVSSKPYGELILSSIAWDVEQGAASTDKQTYVSP